MSSPAAHGKLPSLLNLLAFGNFAVGMGAFVVIGIVSPIAEGLAISKADAAVILTAYALAYAVLSPIAVAVTGSLPRRTVLTGALTLFTVGSVLSALSGSLAMLTLSRIVVALGAALFTPLAAGLAVALSPPEIRGRALARVFGGVTLAQVVGVPFGAWLAYRFGWQATFWAIAILAGTSALVLLRFVPREVNVQQSALTDILGAMKNGRLMFATAFTATIMAAVYVVFTYMGPLIEASAGTNPETRSFYLVLFGIGAVIGNVVGGYLTDRIGPKRTLIIVCIAHMALMPMFSVIPWNPVTFAVLVAVWSLCGWAFMAPQQSRLVGIAPRTQALALALNAAMIYVGIAIGSAIGGRLLAWQGLEILGICAGVGAGVALLHLLASRQPSSPQSP